MGNRVFGPQELKLSDGSYRLHDAEGRCLASGGLAELKSFLACDGPDQAHPHLPAGRYHVSGPGVEDIYYKLEGKCFLGGDECYVASSMLQAGGPPVRCDGPPVHPMKMFYERSGAVVTQYVCRGHVHVMEGVFEMFERDRNARDN
jgi:hypothetical protein